MNLTELLCGNVIWIELAQIRVHWRALVFWFSCQRVWFKNGHW